MDAFGSKICNPHIRSDGMGSGKEAKNSSEQILRLLENLLLSGFDKKASIDLINNALINQNKEVFATLDIAIVDLYEGNVEFIKSAACPTYIKNNKRVQLIKSTSLPTGILEESKIETFDKDINDGEIMLICSDGILDSNVEYKNKELWIKYLLEDIETTNTQKIANLILEEAIGYGVGIIDQREIDEINILNATKEGLTRSIRELEKNLKENGSGYEKPDVIFVDALTKIDTDSIPYKSIIHGDALSYSIAAASIIAKVTRDRIMRQWDEVYPQYGFAKHKGYGTASHIQAIKEYGICPLHRLSFVKNFIQK